MIYYFIFTVLQCDRPPLRTSCGKAPGRDSNPGWADRVKGTQTNIDPQPPENKSPVPSNSLEYLCDNVVHVSMHSDFLSFKKTNNCFAFVFRYGNVLLHSTWPIGNCSDVSQPRTVLPDCVVVMCTVYRGWHIYYSHKYTVHTGVFYSWVVVKYKQNIYNNKISALRIQSRFVMQDLNYVIINY